MSSSNLVRVTYIPETTYGVTPGTGNFETVRFISESLSGTPETVESQQIRTDRLSSGQIVTGLSVGGDINFEFAREAQIDHFIESAMYSTFGLPASSTVDLTYNHTTKQLTRASGTWTGVVSVGDVLTLAGFANAANNTQVIVAQIVSGTVIRIIGPNNMVTETGTGTSYTIASKITIGTQKKSFSIEKAFMDLTDKAVIYKGMIVSQMSLEVAYGQLVTGSFTFSGNHHSLADTAAEFITNGRTINAPATTQTFNGSIDMPLIASSATGAFSSEDICIQRISLTLNNNLLAQNCIGMAAPEDYSAGTAQITVEMSAYLKDEVWAVLSKKITQDPFAIGFLLRNSGGWYGFYLPAVQVSFPDPASAGANQDVLLEMSGTAKVGDNGGSSLVIYRS